MSESLPELSPEVLAILREVWEIPSRRYPFPFKTIEDYFHYKFGDPGSPAYDQEYVDDMKALNAKRLRGM